MAYENLGGTALDYFPCRYGKSKLMFRGPKHKLEGLYTAVLGGTETYGKFIEQPYPALIEEATGVPTVNFGCVNAGIDVFSQDQTVIDACNRAAVTVIQLMGAQNMSNRFYAVHPRRNDRFLRASNLLRTIFREVDFTEVNFTRHLLQKLQNASAEKFSMVEAELKEAWLARMKTLIAKIDGKVHLLWLSDHTPDEAGRDGLEFHDPHFVDRAMIDELAPLVSGVTEVIVDPAEIAEGFDEMVFSEIETAAAREMLGPVAHRKTAEALAGSVMGRV